MLVHEIKSLSMEFFTRKPSRDRDSILPLAQDYVQTLICL